MALNKIKGMGVALVTPFRPDKTIDYDALDRLIEFQIANGADFFVVLGTTAETATLTETEKTTLRNHIVALNNGRRPLVLGLGGNNTQAVIQQLNSTDLSAFEAVLSVVPFYNKPSQEGIYQHFKAIAQASPLPVLLYNVPGRTGVNMTPATVARLAADCPNIAGIKEASGDIGQTDLIIKNRRPGFIVLSGDDAMTFPLISLGAEGVISVIGNAFPHEFSRMVHLAIMGDHQHALAIHHKFNQLFSLLFVDGNPAGVKCALHALGMIDNELRLPLVPTRLATDTEIRSVIQSLRSTAGTNRTPRP